MSIINEEEEMVEEKKVWRGEIIIMKMIIIRNSYQ